MCQELDIQRPGVRAKHLGTGRSGEEDVKDHREAVQDILETERSEEHAGVSQRNLF